MSKKIESMKLIGKKREILDQEGNGVYDMHTLRVEFDSGKVRKVRAFSKPGSLNEDDKEAVQEFVYDRLEDLMREQGRTNYIFLGKLDRLAGNFTPNTRYMLHNGQRADDYFNENVQELKNAVEEMEREEKEEKADDQAVREAFDRAFHGKEPEDPTPKTAAEMLIDEETEREEVEAIRKIFADIRDNRKKKEDPEEILLVDASLKVYTQADIDKIRKEDSTFVVPKGRIKRADVEKLKDPAFARKFRRDQGLLEIPDFLKKPEDRKPVPELVMPEFLKDSSGIRPTTRTQFDRDMDYLEISLRSLLSRMQLIKAQRSSGKPEASMDRELKSVETRIAQIRKTIEEKNGKDAKNEDDYGIDL